MSKKKIFRFKTVKRRKRRILLSTLVDNKILLETGDKLITEDEKFIIKEN